MDFNTCYMSLGTIKASRMWFSAKTCSCYSTKTHINSVILIVKLNLTSLRNIYIKICVVLNEVKFNLRMRVMLLTWVTTTCLRWEPQPVTLWLYPVYVKTYFSLQFPQHAPVTRYSCICIKWFTDNSIKASNSSLPVNNYMETSKWISHVIGVQ